MAFDVAHMQARLTADTSQYDRSMRAADRTAHSTGRNIGKGVAVAGGAILGLGAVAGGFAAKMGLNFYRVREQAEIAFTTMYKGDGAKARKFLDELADFAAKTPFEFPDLVQASQRLMAMGVAGRQVMPVMEAVGDTVAAVGGGAAQIDQVTRAIGQVQAKGRLQAEEMMQLNEAGGFSWRDLAREIGVSVPQAMELVQQGQVDASEFTNAFIDNANKRFDGMMEKQSQTLSGIFSTFKDTFSQISADILTPFFEQAGDALQRINRFLGRVSAASTTRARIRIVWEGARGAATDLFDSIRDALMGTSGTLKPLRLPTGKIIEWERVGASPGFLNTMRDAMEQVDWTSVGRTIGKAIGERIELGRDMIRTMLDWVDSHVQEIADVGLKIGLTMISRLMDPAFWKENWQLILGAAVAVFPFGRVFNLGTRIGFRLGEAFGFAARKAFDTALKFIREMLERVPRWVRQAFRFTAAYVALNRIQEAVADAWDFIKSITETRLFRVFAAIFGRITGIRNLLGLLRNTARFTWEFIASKGQSVVDKVQNIIDKVNALIRTLRNLWNKARSWLPDISGWFGGIGSVAGRVREGIQGGDFGSFGMGATSLVALGRQLQSMGFSVGEHPAFGGVSPVHVPGSYHYSGRALDINWPGGGAAEMSRLDWLYSRLQRMPGVKELLWRTAGHYGHLHVAMDRGGIVPGRRGQPVPILAHAGETVLPTHRRNGFGTTVINVNLPPGSYIYDPEGLMRVVEQASKVSGRRGGPRLQFGT